MNNRLCSEEQARAGLSALVARSAQWQHSHSLNLNQEAFFGVWLAES